MNRSLDVTMTVAIDRARHLAGSWSVLGIAALLVLLSGVSATFGAQVYLERWQQQRALAEQLTRSQFEANDKLMGESMQPGLRGLRPPPTGMIFARGRDPLLPIYVDFAPSGSLETHTPSDVVRDSDIGTLVDLEFIVRVLLGLLAIACGAEAVTRVRSGGWLRAVLSLPVEPWQFFLGAWLGATAVVAAVLGLCAACALLGASLQLTDATAVLTLTLLPAVPAWLLYLGAMTAAGVALAARASRQASPYGAMIVLWLLTSWLGPQLVVAAGRLLRPVTTRAAMEDERADAHANVVREASTGVGQALLVMAKDSPLDLRDAVDVLGPQLDPLWQTYVRQARRAARAVDEPWRQRYLAQQRLVSELSWLMPGSVLAAGAGDAMDTGPAADRVWRRAVDVEQAQLEQKLFDDRPHVSMRVPGRTPMYVRHPALGFADVPLFVAPTVSSNERRWGLIKTDLLLVVYLIVALALALRTPRRGLVAFH